MGIKASEYVWHNGHLVPWDDAKIHVMAHVVNYGSSVFEGIRCYQTPKGPAIFRLQDCPVIIRTDVEAVFHIFRSAFATCESLQERALFRTTNSQGTVHWLGTHRDELERKAR